MQLYYASLPGATVLRLQFLAPEHYGTIHLRTAWRTKKTQALAALAKSSIHVFF